MSDLVLKWSWRYHQLEVDEVDSIDEALGSFYYAIEAGDAAPYAIEVIAEDGTTQRISGDELDHRIDRYREELRERSRKLYPVDNRPVVAKVVIASADGPATFEWFRDRDEAERVGERLMARLGQRVSIESVKR